MHQSSVTKRYSAQSGFFIQALIVVVGAVAIAVWAIATHVLPPASFPHGATFTIEKGDSLGSVAYRLADRGFIKSPEAFKILMLALGSEEDISEGQYYFAVPVTMVEVALKISGKEYGVLQHKVTFPEGFSNKEIAARLAARFEGFESGTFLTLAKDDEGYLFPDTYSFSPSVRPQEVITTMRKNFIEKTGALEQAFATSRRTKKDIIIMASILEKEANSGEETAVVAGILWKRIDRGIPLQVDAPFLYLLGKTSAELTAADLAYSSPFNTYKNRGLPPGPIGNPGLEAIKAALMPIESPYLYYLHDANGVIHYASTHDEHVANKQKYLN